MHALPSLLLRCTRARSHSKARVRASTCTHVRTHMHNLMKKLSLVGGALQKCQEALRSVVCRVIIASWSGLRPLARCALRAASLFLLSTQGWQQGRWRSKDQEALEALSCDAQEVGQDVGLARLAAPG